VEQLSELSESARMFYKLVCSRADEVWPKAADCVGEKVTLDSKVLLAQSQPVMVELTRRSLTAVGCGERDLTQRHFEGILRLAEKNVSGRKIDLPGEFVVGAEYGNLIFSRPQKSEIRSQKTEVRNQKSDVRNLSSVLAVRHPVDCPLSAVVLEVPGQTRFGRYLIEATVLDARYSMLDTRKKTKSRIENRESRIKFVERFDFDKIKPPLVVRFRKAGDRFVPLGLGQEKKVGKFLTAARVPQEVRQKLLIVTDSERIIWVWPIRIAEQAKVTSGTRKILQLQITSMPMQAK